MKLVFDGVTSPGFRNWEMGVNLKKLIVAQLHKISDNSGYDRH